MNHPKNLRIEDFTYALPEERIAKHPLGERDASRILIYKDGTVSEDVYRNIVSHIPPETLLVFNKTKVIHARLIFRKPTGGVIEVFCLEPHQQYGDIQNAMAHKERVWWKCMIGGAGKWKQGMILTQEFPEHHLILSAEITDRETGSFILELSWNLPEMNFAEVLQIAGQVPLPPYLHRQPEEQDRKRYQTIYAAEEGSVAAPTAGLHFTERIMEDLSAQQVHTDFVTLHVGAGTFKPVKSETMAEHEMHAEWIHVSIDFIENLHRHLERGVVAVGTTSLRTLESLYWIGVKILKHSLPDFEHIAVEQWEPYEPEDKYIPPAHAIKALKDWMLQNHQNEILTRTRIIIAPGYSFKIVKGLITNFHQPQSTLLLLVAALIGDDWRKVYDYALKNNFRFLSYGDGSLIWA